MARKYFATVSVRGPSPELPPHEFDVGEFNAVWGTVSQSVQTQTVQSFCLNSAPSPLLCVALRIIRFYISYLRAHLFRCRHLTRRSAITIVELIMKNSSWAHIGSVPERLAVTRENRAGGCAPIRLTLPSNING